MSKNVRSVDSDSSMIPDIGQAGQALTVSNSAVQLAELAETTEKVFWTVDGGAIRVRLDGTDPTASVGLYLENGSGGSWSKRTARAAIFIKAGAADALFFATPMSY